MIGPVATHRSKEISVMTLSNGGVLAVGGMNYLRGTRQPYDLVVLVAQEHQRDSMGAARVIRLPLPDATLTPAQKAAVDRVAGQVAAVLRARGRVLVTCAMGLNRSGMVAALALTKLGMPGRQAIGAIRQLRGKSAMPALFNPNFTRFIRETAPS